MHELHKNVIKLWRTNCTGLLFKGSWNQQ